MHCTAEGPKGTDGASKDGVDSSVFQQLQSQADWCYGQRYGTLCESQVLGLASKDVSFENAHFLGKHHGCHLGSEALVPLTGLSRLPGDVVIWMPV